jgi:hypothetical protein
MGGAHQGLCDVRLPEDTHHLQDRKWSAKQKRKGPRSIAQTNSGGKQEITLHGLILGAAEVDHRDHDGLNNRRGNLRPVTQSQNLGNARWRVGRSGFRGVKRAHDTLYWEPALPIGQSQARRDRPTSSPT